MDIHDVYRFVMRWAGGLDRTEWLMLLAGAFVVGILTLRGFGSRSSY